ncbi:Transcription-repair coupling factor [Pseudomonas syringae pv. actinidiae]|uniref:Transcription-repair coupling factor n=1 Tax=Pseudomonas syringae pv. actinidiae TaxID=103796 RepID=A0A2V0QM78_PSESF|nr:Transcription-repair coupling factor [Pseudomonas syringae pv. actinidiae]
MHVLVPRIIDRQIVLSITFSSKFNNLPIKLNLTRYINNGGERGIRTPDTLLRCTPLAGERLRPLGQLSATRGV